MYRRMNIGVPEWFYKEYIEPYKEGNRSAYIMGMILRGATCDNVAMLEHAAKIKALSDKIQEQHKLIELLQFKLQHNFRL